MVNSSSHGSSRVISFVLMIAFGLLAAVVGYATLKGGAFDLRSRASMDEKRSGSWDFTTNAEGWRAVDLGSSRVEKGIYTLSIGLKPSITETKEYCTGTKKNNNYKCRDRKTTRLLEPRLLRSGLSIPVLASVNKFVAHMAIVLPEGASAPEIIAKNAAGSNTVPVTISFRFKGQKTFEEPITQKVVADGTQQEVSYVFADTAKRKTIEAIQISYAPLRALAKTIILVDDIKMIGLTQEELSTSPTPVCHYQEVQCVKAPCDPILVCDSPTPTP